jgi:pteridine reductase
VVQGQVVLITGGAKRVGAAICRSLHAAGANLMVHYRSSSTEAHALQDELNAIRADSVALTRADILKLSSLPSLVNDTVERFGRLDVLVNNASSYYATPVGEVTEPAWEDLLGTNLKAPLFLSQAAAPHLRRSHGCIVNIVDIHAERPLKNYLVYNAAKGGLVTLTRSLARELGPDVRVNAVAPGAIMWPEDGEWQDEVSRQRIISSSLLKRVGEPEDIARAVMSILEAPPHVEIGDILLRSSQQRM